MLEPKVLAQHLNDVLQAAKENYIKELKVFGKHIGQKFEMQAGINFIIEPHTKMTIWHKRNFESSTASILDATVETYSSVDIGNLVKENIITAEQAKNYISQAVNLEQYVLQLNKPSMKNALPQSAVSRNASANTQVFSIEQFLDYLRANEQVWNEVNSHPELLADAYASLSARKTAVK